MTSTRYAALGVAIAIAASAGGEIINVPGDYPTLDQALVVAADGDEVVLAPGEFPFFFHTVDEGVSITVRGAGAGASSIVDGVFVVDGVLILEDLSAADLSIEAGGGAVLRRCDLHASGGAALHMTPGSTAHVSECVFTSDGSAPLVAVESTVTIERSLFDGTNAGGPINGVDAINAIETVIEDCVFTNLEVAVNADEGTLELRSSYFSGNERAVNVGSDVSEAVIEGCQFEDNLGGVSNAAPGVVRDSTFRRNGSLSPVRLPLHLAAPDGCQRVEDCHFEENAIVGAIRISRPGGESHVVSCTFEGNHTAGRGVLDVRQGGGVAIVSCRFVGNSAEYEGGAVAAMTSFTMVNCVVANNDSKIAGGGVAMLQALGAPASIVNCTFVGNTAAGGGQSIDIGEADAFVSNCIVRSAFPVAGTVTVQYSNVTGGEAGVGNIDAEPTFVDAEAHDYRLAAGSPGIDAGSNFDVPDDVADIDGNGFFDEPTPLDRSGLARFADDPATDDTGQGMAPVVDMGAHEFADACRADLDASGVVDVIDLVLLLANWGGSGAGDITSAIPGIPDGVVDTHDLLDVLAQWGSCA